MKVYFFCAKMNRFIYSLFLCQDLLYKLIPDSHPNSNNFDQFVAQMIPEPYV
jgi:hypothetical protein